MTTDPNLVSATDDRWLEQAARLLVNLGFTLIAFNYLLSWGLAIVYGRIAASKFDPLAAKAATEISGRSN